MALVWTVIWFVFALVISAVVLLIYSIKVHNKIDAVTTALADVDMSDPYAARCPFCMAPIVNERCDNLNCWFEGNIVPIPEFIKKRSSNPMPMTPALNNGIMTHGEAWYAMYQFSPLPPRAYLDMSMATPQVRGLTAEQIRNMTIEQYAQLRPQLIARAKSLHEYPDALPSQP